MSKHTPGPWKMNRTSGQIFAQGVRHLRGHLYVNIKDVANARLIEAAPELLSTCKAALEALENMTTEEFSRGADKPIRELLTSVIAKVEQE